MAQAKFYEYKKCSTCVKARKFLEKKTMDYKSIDITEQPPTKKELEFMIDQYDGEIKKLFNTSGVQYRELKIKDKIGTMTKKQAIDLLAKNGKLVKRPFFIHGNKGVVGFKEDAWKSLL
ncbi:MAG: arsenate reductase family protein [Bdellovibrionales bacterium]|nr:arsenate reductase family protein [Bdellovibrionales bacterium]NQZ18930.1 arsenate reductase family protein [Bdellovibrionales bacterium]